MVLLADPPSLPVRLGDFVSYIFLLTGSSNALRLSSTLPRLHRRMPRAHHARKKPRAKQTSAQGIRRGTAKLSACVAPTRNWRLDLSATLSRRPIAGFRGGVSRYRRWANRGPLLCRDGLT